MKRVAAVLIAIVIFSSTAYAGIAKIVAARGDIIVTRDGKLLPAKTGFELEKKDIVTTQDKAKAQIIFEDKTVITIGKSSVFKIEEYLYDEKNPELSFNVSKGAFRAITGKIGKIAPDRFKLKTKTATIGIRGTQILGEVGQKPEAPVRIAFTEGHGYVQTPQGTVDIEAGQITNVTPGKAPTPPRAYKPTEINQMGSASGGGGETMGSSEVIDETSDEGTGPDEGEPAPGGNDDPLDDPGGEPGLDDPDPELPPIPVPEPPEVPDVSDPKDLETELGIVEDVLTADVDDPMSLLPSFVDHLNDQKIVIDSDPYMSWGAWIESDADSVNYGASELLEYWVAGDLTPTTTIDEYMKDSSATYTYRGDVEGVIYTPLIQERATGNMNLTFNFGNSDITGSINMTGKVEGTLMELSVGSATVNNDGFTIDSFTGTIGDVDVASGSASGNFYGTDAQAVGGTFGVAGSDGVSSASGAFAGTK